MSYGGAEKQVSYLERSNRFSTHPFKRGANEHLATQKHDVQYSALSVAREMVQAVCDRDRRDQLIAKSSAIFKEISELNEQMLETLPFNEFKQIKDRRVKAGMEHQRIQNELASIRLPDAAPTRFKSEIFLAIVKRLLPKDDWKEIVDAMHKAIEESGFIFPD